VSYYHYYISYHTTLHSIPSHLASIPFNQFLLSFLFVSSYTIIPFHPILYYTIHFYSIILSISFISIPSYYLGYPILPLFHPILLSFIYVPSYSITHFHAISLIFLLSYHTIIPIYHSNISYHNILPFLFPSCFHSFLSHLTTIPLYHIILSSHLTIVPLHHPPLYIYRLAMISYYHPILPLSLHPPPYTILLSYFTETLNIIFHNHSFSIPSQLSFCCC
jgi:hypothetical protein